LGSLNPAPPHIEACGQMKCDQSFSKFNSMAGQLQMINLDEKEKKDIH
jgi:hypothetical protein